MFRLALIAVESGACVANPVYETEEECYEQIHSMTFDTGKVKLDKDLDGRTYIVPARPNDFVFVIEPVMDEDYD